MKERVLIVDDEKDIVKMLEYNLKKEGYITYSAFDGEEALNQVAAKKPDIIILDLMLPKIDGLEVCKTIKKDDELAFIPVIMLTAKTQEADKVAGLEIGADDYITKPFSPRELIARVKAVLRRVKEKDRAPQIFNIGKLMVDLSKITVTVNNTAVDLTSKEFELLAALIKARGRVLSREYLLDNIWGYDNAIDIQTRTVDVHIMALRRKLKSEAKRIITVKNYGYKFKIE
ncbi:MAG: DNA-binding response regulator [Candidatus Omnitrophota bacterium]|jgi:two-component system alkaline phosphatase synthesis response regulator PhoP|nr:MAG: DNA-binding response regulator [Candidatus Omnitrophota bacterium]